MRTHLAVAALLCSATVASAQTPVAVPGTDVATSGTAALQAVASDALFARALATEPDSGSDVRGVALTTGGVALVGGALYVALLDGSDARATASDLPGAGFVIADGDDRPSWTAPHWTPSEPRQAMAMPIAPDLLNPTEVSTVPEPATVVLSASGLLALGAVGALRRRRASRED